MGVHRSYLHSGCISHQRTHSAVLSTLAECLYATIFMYYVKELNTSAINDVIWY